MQIESGGFDFAAVSVGLNQGRDQHAGRRRVCTLIELRVGLCFRTLRLYQKKWG